MPEFPLVSVVTPTYNMGRYLRETVESVLAQDYPNVEYLVMDGGSTDGTVEILRSYGDRLRYASEPDHGTADAINKGFLKTTGSIFAYLNADDTYLPGAISAAVAHLREHPDAAVVYGDGYWVDSSGRTIGPYPAQPYDPKLLQTECFICQPASFIRRGAFEQAGMLDPRLHFTFDYDLWIRIARLRPMTKMDRLLATSRMHRENKTVGQRRGVLEETMRMLSSHYGYVPFHWVCAYVCHLVDGKDQFFERTQLSLTKYALTLVYGLRRNTRHPFRFVREWVHAMSLGGLVRRSRAFFSGLSR